MTPTMIETARALAAVWTGPPLVQFVVSKAAHQVQCSRCTKPWPHGGAAYCPDCGDRPPRTVRTKDAVTVPALDGSPEGLANVGPLLAAMPFSWGVYNPRTRHCGHKARRGLNAPHYRGSSAAHALALAFLAAS